MASRSPLTHERVTDVAAALADRHGLEAVTLARVADELGVRTPSLYHHVDGLAGLHRALTLRALDELGQCLQGAAVGRAGSDALRGVAAAYRDFARQRPGLYATTVPSHEDADAEVRDAGHRVLATVLAALAGYGFNDEAQIHAARALRSLLHGFATLEVAGGFGLPVDIETSFDWLLGLLTTGFADLAGSAAAADG